MHPQRKEYGCKSQDPSLSPKRPCKWIFPYLAATVQMVVVIQTFSLQKGQVLPRFDVVAQMDEDFSITEDLTFRGNGGKPSMRNLLMELQEPRSAKRPELQFLQWLLGGSGDMGLNERTRKTFTIFISKILTDYVCMRELWDEGLFL